MSIEYLTGLQNWLIDNHQPPGAVSYALREAEGESTDDNVELFDLLDSAMIRVFNQYIIDHSFPPLQGEALVRMVETAVDTAYTFGQDNCDDDSAVSGGMEMILDDLDNKAPSLDLVTFRCRYCFAPWPIYGQFINIYQTMANSGQSIIDL
jgi:hypothetical protein